MLEIFFKDEGGGDCVLMICVVFLLGVGGCCFILLITDQRRTLCSYCLSNFFWVSGMVSKGRVDEYCLAVPTYKGTVPVVPAERVRDSGLG